jgi:hypothetical protein
MDAMIASGTPIIDVSRTFHVSEQSLRRHRDAGHIPGIEKAAPRKPVVPGLDAAEVERLRATASPVADPEPAALPAIPRATTIENAEDVIADLQRLRNEAFDLFEGAKARKDWQRAQQLFSQLVAIIDRFGEMHRVLGPKGSVNVVIDNSSRALTVLAKLSDAELRAIIAGKPAEPVTLAIEGRAE